MGVSFTPPLLKLPILKPVEQTAIQEPHILEKTASTYAAEMIKMLEEKRKRFLDEFFNTMKRREKELKEKSIQISTLQRDLELTLDSLEKKQAEIDAFYKDHVEHLLTPLEKNKMQTEQIRLDQIWRQQLTVKNL